MPTGGSKSMVAVTTSIRTVVESRSKGDNLMGDMIGHARVALAMAAVLSLAACGGHSTRTSGSEPAQNGAFVSDAFSNLPKPGGSMPFEPATETDGVWAQSFEIHSLGAAETIEFYKTALAEGWTQLSRRSSGGHCSLTDGAVGDGCTYRSVWTNHAQRLEISTGPDGADSSGGGGTELSLLLIPEG
jgi:hypothetical protein